MIELWASPVKDAETWSDTIRNQRINGAMLVWTEVDFDALLLYCKVVSLHVAHMDATFILFLGRRFQDAIRELAGICSAIEAASDSQHAMDKSEVSNLQCLCHSKTRKRLWHSTIVEVLNGNRESRHRLENATVVGKFESEEGEQVQMAIDDEESRAERTVQEFMGRCPSGREWGLDPRNY